MTGSLFDVVGITATSRDRANDLLIAWKHELGPCDRPFGQDQWVLHVETVPVALAVTASIVSPTLRDETEHEWARREIVELARIARAPEAWWAMRVMLRLWREVLAHRWTHWPVQLAASYALPGKTGDLYRFDGWTKVRTVKKASPGSGSTWAKSSKADAVADGRKTLWTYPYHSALSGCMRANTNQGDSV